MRCASSGIGTTQSSLSKHRKLKLRFVCPHFPWPRNDFTQHVPHPWDSNVAPCTSYLALGVQSPDRLEPRADLWSEYAAQRVSRITITVEYESIVQQILVSDSPRAQKTNKQTNKQKNKKKKRRDLPSRKDHGICIERTPIVKLQTLGCEAGYLGVILELNLPIDYQLARANVCDLIFASGEFS